MSIDPVTMPDAYRQSLLAALGDDDPAEVLAGGPETFRSLIEEGARKRLAPGSASTANADRRASV